MVEQVSTAAVTDEREPFYGFWEQFFDKSEEFAAPKIFSEKAAGSPEGDPGNDGEQLWPVVTPVRLEEISAKFAEGFDGSSRAYTYLEKRWDLAKAISRAAVPRVQGLCDARNAGANVHNCPSQAVCDLLERVKGDNPSAGDIAALATALLLPKEAEERLTKEAGLTPRQVSVLLEVPYFSVYHWMGRD